MGTIVGLATLNGMFSKGLIPLMNTFTRGFRTYAAAYSLITIVQAGARLLVFIIAAKLLGPDEYAQWPLVQALMSYSMFIGFGVMPALARDLPISKGAGDEERYFLVLGASVRFLSLFWLIITVIATVYIVLHFEYRFYAYGAYLAVLQSVIQFFLKIHRSKLDFKRLFKGIFYSILWLPVTVFFLYYFNCFDVLCGLYSISLIIQLIVVFDLNSLRKIKNTGYRQALKVVPHLLTIGIPLMISVSIITMLFSIDRWLVNSFFDKLMLGKYGFAVFGAMGIQLLITSIGQVFYPTMAHGYGANNTLSSQHRYIYSYLIITLVIVTGLVLATWLILPYIAVHWFPDYMEGISAARWMVLGGLVLPFATLCSMMLRIKNILWPLVISQGVGMISATGIIYTGCTYGTLEAVGKSVMLSYFFYTICVGIVTAYFFKKYITHKLFNMSLNR